MSPTPEYFLSSPGPRGTSSWRVWLREEVYELLRLRAGPAPLGLDLADIVSAFLDHGAADRDGLARACFLAFLTSSPQDFRLLAARAYEAADAFLAQRSPK